MNTTKRPSNAAFVALLRRFDAWHGFDVLAFEDAVTDGHGTPAGMSLAQWITTHYGAEACATVRARLTQ